MNKVTVKIGRTEYVFEAPWGPYHGDITKYGGPIARIVISRPYPHVTMTPFSGWGDTVDRTDGTIGGIVKLEDRYMCCHIHDVEAARPVYGKTEREALEVFVELIATMRREALAARRAA